MAWPATTSCRRRTPAAWRVSMEACSKSLDGQATRRATVRRRRRRVRRLRLAGRNGHHWRRGGEAARRGLGACWATRGASAVVMAASRRAYDGTARVWCCATPSPRGRGDPDAGRRRRPSAFWDAVLACFASKDCGASTITGSGATSASTRARSLDGRTGRSRWRRRGSKPSSTSRAALQQILWRGGGRGRLVGGPTWWWPPSTGAAARGATVFVSRQSRPPMRWAPSRPSQAGTYAVGRRRQPRPRRSY